MSSLLRFILLFLVVLFKVNADTDNFQQPDIIYAHGHTADDFNSGPKSAKHQINSQNFAEFNNNNQPNYYQNQNSHQGNNQNARIIVQSNGAPTIQTVYESSNSQESSNQQSSKDSRQSSNTTHTQFLHPQAVIINGNQGYGYNHNQNGIGQAASLDNNYAVHQNIPPVIHTTTLSPGYQTSTSSSSESSSQSSSSNSAKSSSQFNSQTTTANPIYHPQIVQVTTPVPQPQFVHVTTPYSVQFDNNQHGSIDGSYKYLPPVQTNYQSSSTPATSVQTFESSTQSSSEHESNSKSSTQSSQKTTIVSTTGAPDISHGISMSVTPTPYTISVSTPQTYDISHSSVPITPIAPMYQPVPVQPGSVYKPILQPAPFAIPVAHNSEPTPPTIFQHVPTTQPLHITPPAPVVQHMPSPQPAYHHMPVATEIPVTEVPEHHGHIEKTINVPQPGTRTQTYEIRRPAIQKQFYDIEERVIVRPAGSVVVEIDQPLSKTATGGEVITPIGGHGISEGHNNVHTQGTGQIHNSGTVFTENQGHGITVGYNNGIYSHGLSPAGGVYTGNHEGHNNIHTQGTGQIHNSGTVFTENQGHGITVGHNNGIHSHGLSPAGGVYTGNHGQQHFITTGGNNYQHVFGTFGYYPYPNFCDQFNKFAAGPAISVHNPSIGHTDQQYQPSHQAVTSTTINPIHSTTSAALTNFDNDSVVINGEQQQPSEKYMDSTTQSSQSFSTTTPTPFFQNPAQQSINTNNRPMPHMLAVGDPDFQSPPYVEIRPKSESTNKINDNNLNNQQQTAVRGDLHNTGAHTLYTMQSVMNDEYLNQHQPNQQNNQPTYEQQVNFNQHQQSVPKNNSEPYIVYAITGHNPNNYVAPQQRQLVFPQQNVRYTVQQQPGQYNDAFTQESNQLPQQYNHQQSTPQQNTPYIIAGNQHGISHSPLAYSSSYYNQRIPNTPINRNFNTYNQSPPSGYNQYTQNPNGANTRLYTGPAIFPKQGYEKESAAYRQPQNFVNYQQQSPSQQIFYTQNPTFPQGHQLPAQRIVYSNNNNQGQKILGNQGQEFQVQNPQQFISQNNNTQFNSQLNQASPVQISFNESDSYPIINIRNDIDNKQTQNPSQTIQYNSKYTEFNGNGTKNQDYTNNPANSRFGGDISPQQQDSQPQSSYISGQYQNVPSVNINFQPNENQNKLLNLILSNKGTSGINDNSDDDLTSKSHIISATPAPKFSEPAGERVHTRRIVVNHPLETVQVVHEQIPVTNYNQPTVYKTSSVGLERAESSVPVFYQPQQLSAFQTVHHNNHQPISYSFTHRN